MVVTVQKVNETKNKMYESVVVFLSAVSRVSCEIPSKQQGTSV